MFYPHYIFNFPTKNHWRNGSKYSYIIEGLTDLQNCIKKYNIKSVTIPRLGCGNGGLDWDKVKPLIIKTMEQLPNVVTVIIE